MAAQQNTRSNGVLPITASQTSGNASKQSIAKLPTQKLKVIVRRLAPGLTEEEFTTILGDEWRAGQGKVDWFDYKNGKDSKDPSKPSRPSRAYLHLTSEVHLLRLSEAVRQSAFEDAANTFNSPALIGPPTVEFAPYGRTPGGRRRTDARAGTIDQDPEFMAFLEGLANPITTKEAEVDESLDGIVGKSEKITTTPLVQFLKDRKASKNKDAAAKAAKKQEIQTARTKSARESSKDTSSLKDSSNSPEDVKKKGKELKIDKSVEKVAKETVKILNRQAAANSTISAAQGSVEGSPGTKLDISKIPSRQRSTVLAAHIRMLQRDLGLSPAQAHRQVRRDTADAQKAERAAATDANAGKTAVESKDAASPQTPQTPQSPAVPTAPKGSTAQTARRNRGKALETEVNKAASPSITTPASAGPSTPVILLKKPETPQSSLAPKPITPIGPAGQSTKSTPAAITRKPAAIAVPSAGATQAFVKHANPSQGVTESLLKEAMEKFGAVSMVEIDKKKGFAYVNFVEPDGLRKAMAANPISVAQGTVQVMQRKGTALPPEKKAPPQAPQAPSRGGRGGGRGGTIGRRGGRGGRGGGGDAAKSPASASTPSGPAIPTGPSAK